MSSQPILTGASQYATLAVARALAMARVVPDQVDLIIGCTFSGDYLFPPLSAKVQRDIQAPKAQIFDIQANCSGFVTGLTVASDRMKVDEEVRYAVVVGVELCTRYIDRTDVNTAIFLSDGREPRCWLVVSPARVFWPPPFSRTAPILRRSGCAAGVPVTL